MKIVNEWMRERDREQREKRRQTVTNFHLSTTNPSFGKLLAEDTPCISGSGSDEDGKRVWMKKNKVLHFERYDMA